MNDAEWRRYLRGFLDTFDADDRATVLTVGEQMHSTVNTLAGELLRDLDDLVREVFDELDTLGDDLMRRRVLPVGRECDADDADAAKVSARLRHALFEITVEAAATAQRALAAVLADDHDPELDTASARGRGAIWQDVTLAAMEGPFRCAH